MTPLERAAVAMGARLVRESLEPEVPPGSPVDYGDGFIEGWNSGARTEYEIWRQEVRAFIKRMEDSRL